MSRSIGAVPGASVPSSWDLIRAFLALSTELQLGPAADRLGVSSRTLSRHMAQLEGELGVPLMIRSTRRITLTPAGEELRAHALLIDGTMRQAMTAVSEQTHRPGW